MRKQYKITNFTCKKITLINGKVLVPYKEVYVIAESQNLIIQINNLKAKNLVGVVEL